MTSELRPEAKTTSRKNSAWKLLARSALIVVMLDFIAALAFSAEWSEMRSVFPQFVLVGLYAIVFTYLLQSCIDYFKSRKR